MERSLIEIIQSINDNKIGKQFYTVIGGSGELKVGDVDVKVGEDGNLVLDKHGSLARTFKEWAKNNFIAQAVLDGNTTFAQEFQKAFGSYKTAGNFSAPFIPPEGYALQHLEDSIGKLPRNDSLRYNLTENPFMATAVGAAGGLGFVALMSLTPENKHFRRKFIKYFGSLFGTICGIAALSDSLERPGSQKDSLSLLEANARYLDKAVVDTFRSQTGTVLPKYDRRDVMNLVANTIKYH